jgi:hypothetical protein
MPTQNELQYRYSKQMGEIRKLYPPVIEAILERLAEGDTVAVAVDKGFNDARYTQHASEVTVGNTIGAAEFGLGEQLTLNLNIAPDYFLFTKFSDGVSLSDTLHSGEAQAAVKKVLNNYFKYKGNVNDLAKKLRDVNRAPRVNLPRELRKLIDAREAFGAQTPQFKRQLKEALKGVNSLTDESTKNQLRKAYTRLSTVLEKPTSTTKQVEAAINYAMAKKVDSVNKAIARTEIAKSYEMSFQRQMQEGGFLYEQFTLSSAHPRVDQCDFCAEADLYGLGAGISPIGKGFSIPVHTNCLCSKVALYEPEKSGSGRYSAKRADEYLDGLSEVDRKRVVGAKYSENGNYEKGLEKKGISPNPKPRMIAKKVIRKA